MPIKQKYTSSHTISYGKRFLLAVIFIALVFGIGSYLKSTSTTIYTGTLPCADCIGIKTQLTLHGNNTYALQSIYIDKGTPYTEKGTWDQEEKNNMQVYVLHSGKLVSYFQIVNNTSIKMLDIYGRPITAPFNMTLQKQ